MSDPLRLRSLVVSPLTWVLLRDFYAKAHGGRLPGGTRTKRLRAKHHAALCQWWNRQLSPAERRDLMERGRQAIEEFNASIARHRERVAERLAELQAHHGRTARANDAARPLLADDPEIRRAVERLRPKKGSGLESVTISSGSKSVTLEAH